ncbi:MAG: BrnT family toxin [Acidobacteriaceae bacterium]|nr:BrnT family toxin [Acidobacteriaceae bacterium]
MGYEWDATKNAENIAKHGVDFADAVPVFEDDYAITTSMTTPIPASSAT